jgi:phosphatidylglycerophosphate synthase
MSTRVSHSLLDPWITKPLKGLYKVLPLPKTLPPEAIVGCGHLAAIAGAVGLALSTRTAWGGLLGAAGVMLNHVCDVLDGTHARATNQCRNGGELLDHFVDPLSFSYWVAGLSASAAPATAAAPWLGMAGILVIYATAVLTSIRAKMIGEFTLARFGPTEFKSLLAALALVQAVNCQFPGGAAGAARLAVVFLVAVGGAGLVQLVLSLVRSVRDVNELGAVPADTTEWKLES